MALLKAKIYLFLDACESGHQTLKLTFYEIVNNRSGKNKRIKNVINNIYIILPCKLAIGNHNMS